PTALLLLHLRHILIIRFAGQRKGVLRYYSPRTASYFFSAQSGELATWFGPIQQLSWHGGTWRDEAEDTLGFHTMTNPEAPDWRPEANRQAFHIGSEHAEALQRQQAERFLYQWWSKNPVPSFNQAWNWLEEGRRFGLVSSDALSNYLDARCAHPDSNLPVAPPPTNEMERLEYLTTHLRQSVKDKERYTCATSSPSVAGQPASQPSSSFRSSARIIRAVSALSFTTKPTCRSKSGLRSRTSRKSRPATHSVACCTYGTGRTSPNAIYGSKSPPVKAVLFACPCLRIFVPRHGRACITPSGIRSYP